MITRSLSRFLYDWKDRDTRKPLIIRGARQVGKTTVVREFAKEYNQFLYLNLEIASQRAPFDEIDDIDTLVQRLFLESRLRLQAGSTLVFIDEIQASPAAIRQLRYFHERFPYLHVVAAGSLLEHALHRVQHFPVGRVEYAVLHPVNFPEFLRGLGEEVLNDAFAQIPVPNFAHARLKRVFHQYAVIGGMPEVVQNYIDHRDITQLPVLYESVFTGYRDDAAKYARNKEEERLILHAIDTAPVEAGTRIRFAGFGASHYKSREMGEALRTLEKSRLLELVYPTTSTVPPPIPDKKKSPRLQFLDTGLVNYAMGLQSQLMAVEDLNHLYKGRIIEHLVVQELISVHHFPSWHPSFWVRQKPTSMAETDCLIPAGKYLIPVEIKSGNQGHLRSLQEYMDVCPHQYAIRVHGGEFSIHPAMTSKGKPYVLLNLPYYLGTQLPSYAQWMTEEYPEGKIS